MSDMIDIFYEEYPGKWKQDSYDRTILLDQLCSDYQNTLTLWGDGTEHQRVKMVGKLPSNEYILERSVRYIHNTNFKSFLKIKCETLKIGNYLGKEGKQESHNIFKLIPIIEDQGDDSFSISVEGQPSKKYTQCLHIEYEVPNPIVNDNSKGLFIGEVKYYINNLNDHIYDLLPKLQNISFSIQELETKSIDQKLFLENLTQIIYHLEKILDGKKHYLTLKIYIDFVIPNLRNYPNELQLLQKIYKMLSNKPSYSFEGYGEWIYFSGIIINKNVTRNIDLEPIRKEIRGYWKNNKLNGPCFYLNSNNLNSIHINMIYFKNNKELFNYFFQGKLEKTDVENFIVSINNEDILILENYLDEFESKLNRFTIEAVMKQEIASYLIVLYLTQDKSKYLKKTIDLILSMNINVCELIRFLPEIDTNTISLYTGYLSDNFISSLMSGKSSHYYQELLSRTKHIFENDDEKLISTIIVNTPKDILAKYKNNNDESLLNTLTSLYLNDPEYAKKLITDLLKVDPNLVNNVDKNYRNFIQHLLYISQDYFGVLKYDINSISSFIKTFINYPELNINNQDINGLTILHMVLMIKDIDKDLVSDILDRKPDMKLKSKYPIVATPLQVAITYKQSEGILELIKDKIGEEEYTQQSQEKVKILVKDIFNTKIYNYKEEEVEYEIKDIEDVEITSDDNNAFNFEVEEDNKEKEDLDRINDVINEDEENEKINMENIIDDIISAKNYEEIKNILLDQDDINKVKDTFNNYAAHAILLNEKFLENKNYKDILDVFYKLKDLEYNAINMRNGDGETALFLLVNNYNYENDKEGYLNLLKFIIEDMMADPNIDNNQDYSVLDSEISNGTSKDILEYLLERGATISKTDINNIDSYIRDLIISYTEKDE